MEDSAVPTLPSYEASCYLCPSNTRANGEVNPAYEGTFTFTNDFSALYAGVPSGHRDMGLLRMESAEGECRVICFSPRHDLTLATMDHDQRCAVVDMWCAQDAELSEMWEYVQIFENRGAMMGASNPHPHGQIWASSHVPTLVKREIETQMEYFSQPNRRRMLVDYAEQEVALGARIVELNDFWVWLVPFWAVWPFEVLLIPRHEVSQLHGLSYEQKVYLADILGKGLGHYDRLFGAPFPYSMGWHGCDRPGFQLHAHFYPPLLRSATVRKFMVGYEMLGESQRDITPEQAAERLRNA